MRLEPLANLPQAARRALAEIGPVWGTDIQRHRDIVLKIYRPLLAAAPKAGVEVTRGIAYGTHPRKILDAYRHTSAAKVPVVLFVHGGAFVRGDKDVTDEVYANVGYYFARHGYLALNVEYRLAPESRYPGGADDLAAAIAWAKRSARDLGGDPERLVLVGHSAGATHVAGCAWDPNMPVRIDPAVKGIVLISGRLRADARPDNPNAAGVRAYFGDDESQYEARSPVTYAGASQLPVFLAIAEHENPLLDVYGAETLYRIAIARGRAPRFLRLPRHNHISIIAHVNTEEDTLGAAMRDFFANECGLHS
ncbi:MAG TPA: alpha/beta hydrolase [Burkholderiales bacterium]|nr:alpha/beta hydrolase [Burkholderiales bacterium]